ncbi:HAD hydrolase-like protein [Bifidobacterium psychraerophilum]|jgi:phosphoglycolate phosphatase|uniref:Putative hydrolase or phosphatase n=1 Tax=Bifidobacterium psychraerophilum TaxID=218140 RepID=A0A087CCZ1_9BIFI|nr:HAD hydrolase-like protein [Bifidobacterium psychraerophilum]KFI81141.1 putative hydrolase or phosphatase [Bifidobacterium psychraerophilum]PKA95483.1 phosphoglycolate phosphatase [Bifidobacterium psychraerophilum DSM 22366]
MANRASRVVLLDLDGTLTESAPGILSSVRKTLEDLHQPVPDAQELNRFIGPAIMESMHRNGLRGETLERSVKLYRRYYSEIDTFDDPQQPGHLVPGCLYNSVYEGIPEQLRKLRDDGYYLAVATCKPEYQAGPVCEHFGIDAMVDAVYGASRDNSRINKDQVIRYAFENIGFDPEHGDKAVMVGDRWTDVDGAIAVGLDAIGCAWGYAEDGELKEHGAYEIIQHVDELENAVEQYFTTH